MRPLFKGGNYSREETIKKLEVLTAESIQGRKVFKGGNYSRKYGKQTFMFSSVLKQNMIFSDFFKIAVE